eukprot:UN01660
MLIQRNKNQQQNKEDTVNSSNAYPYLTYTTTQHIIKRNVLYILPTLFDSNTNSSNINGDNNTNNNSTMLFLYFISLFVYTIILVYICVLSPIDKLFPQIYLLQCQPELLNTIKSAGNNKHNTTNNNNNNNNKKTRSSHNAGTSSSNKNNVLTDAQIKEILKTSNKKTDKKNVQVDEYYAKKYGH